MKKQRLLKIVQKADNGYLSNSSCISRDYIVMDSCSIKNKGKKITESGRSMVEMLGVLAIIGVLSIGAVAGYKFALNKFRANEIINELNARALSVSAQMLSATTPYESDEVIEDGFGNTLAVGYLTENIVQKNPEYFKIFVDAIPSEVCTQILREYDNPIMIFVNGTRYNNDTGLCTTETGIADMSFAYRRDLGERETCSNKGYFGEEDFICHCAGNTYIDPNNPNECLCPGGYIWSAESGEHGECIESACPAEHFESAQNGCIPCNDPTEYYINNTTTHIAQCSGICGQYRDTTSVSGVNNLKLCAPKCGPNEFRSHMGCTPCLATTDFGGGYEMLASADECAKCPNERTLFAGYYCVLNTWCSSDGYFIQPSLSGGAPTCTACSSTTPQLHIGTHSDYQTMCNEKCDNRTAIGSYCVRTTCTDTEFTGNDGGCYDCAEIKKIFVGTDEALITKCTACGNRIVTTDGYCKISPCNGVELEDGSCYDCSYTKYAEKLYVSTEADKTACETDCPNRKLILDTYGRYQCIKPDHCSASQFIDAMDYCRNCNESGPRKITDSYLQERCMECPTPYERFITDDNYCVRKDRCNMGTQFILSTGVCNDCGIVESYRIGRGSIERNLCSSCTTVKRFWADDKCYRCDTAETPTVITEEEINNCISCNREVVENKCILKK